MRSLLLVTMLGGLLGAAVPAAEQSLADVARNSEAARNASPGKPRARVYTNKDLPTADRLPPVPVAANTTPSAPAPAPPPSGGTLTVDTKSEAYWRDRMRPLRERLDDLRARADDTKRRAETLMRSADQCFRLGVVCEDYTESLRLTEEHKTLVAEAARAEKEVTALQEEARRAGVPPGWLRD